MSSAWLGHALTPLCAAGGDEGHGRRADASRFILHNFGVGVEYAHRMLSGAAFPTHTAVTCARTSSWEALCQF